MIVVVGGGPAGSFAAWQLARAGEQVTIYEEHALSGIPVQCTGLVTKVLWDLVPKDEEFLMNTLETVRVNSPNGSSIDMPLTEYVLNRASFDQWLVKQASSAGAKVKYGHRFLSQKGGVLGFEHKGQVIHEKAELVIGADGPRSDVARSAGLLKNRKYWIALQARVTGDFSQSVFETWFGRQWAPGFFAWSVPEAAGISRVGVGTMHRTRQYFDQILKHCGGKILDYQAGPIPIYNHKAKCSNEEMNTYLVGDAATLAKATTGGGIITGMLSSKILADCLLNGKDYEKELKPLRKELWLSLLIRKTLDQFSDEDYDKLIARMSKPKVKQILHEYPREYPSRFLLRLLMAQPKFALYGKAAVKAMLKK